MMNLAGRMFPFALRAIAVLPLVLVAMQGQATDAADAADAAPNDTDCETAWTSSSASNSCGEDSSTYYINAVSPSVDTNTYHVVASNGECSVEVDCLKSDTTVAPVANEYSGSTDQVESLSNCEGTLKAGSC